MVIGWRRHVLLVLLVPFFGAVRCRYTQAQEPVWQGDTSVIIRLKDRPLHRIATSARAVGSSQIVELSGKVRQIIGQSSMSVGLAGGQLRRLHEQIDRLSDAAKQDIGRSVAMEVRSDQQKIIELIEQNGGQVTAVSSLANCIGAALPADGGRLLDLLLRSELLESVRPDRIYTLDLDASNCMLATDIWWNANPPVIGGSYDAALLDSGVRETHIYLRYRNPPDSNEREIFKKLPGYANSHGTQTAGIMASTHGVYSGVAFGLDALFDAAGNNIMAESALMENIDWVLNCPLTAQVPEVINNSYSLYGHTEEYGDYFYFLDAVVDDLGVAVVKSAGNQGPAAVLGYPQSYNLISVANMDIFDTCDSSDDVIRYTSSRGPTPSGRRKPDITAPGQNTYTTHSVSDTGFANHTGTSAAAPHVAGAVILLADGGVGDPMAQKAILINTATSFSDNGTLSTYTDDGPVGGDRWDATYGWGVLDLQRVYHHLDDWFGDSVTAKNSTSVDDDYKLYKGHMAADDKATLVWHSRASYNGASTPETHYLLTDLNLQLYDANDGGLVDEDIVHQGNNVHQVSSDSARQVAIKVYSNSETIEPDDSERYVLATVEGFEVAAPPGFVLLVSMPSNVLAGQEFEVSAVITNNGDLAAYSNQISLAIPDGFELVAGENPKTPAVIDSGPAVVLGWFLKAPFIGGEFDIAVDVSSECYGEVYLGHAADSIYIGRLGCPADLNGDGYLDVLDLSILAEQWLCIGCDAPNWCGMADMDGSSKVDLKDFARFSDQWPQCHGQ